MTLTASREPLRLLKTKLFRPRPTGDLLHRARLHETLSSYLDRSVTLVSAPAGFGKTTMLADWLEHAPCRSAWLSLDTGDNELAVFLAYFVAAVRTVFPRACADTLALLQAPVLPPLSALATTLANDFEALSADDNPSLVASPCSRFVLVLDDYHLVREPAVHSLLTALLHHPSSALHLIISARHDPPFLDSALRARGDFSEIRSAELRFTADETASFMQQSLKTRLDPELLAMLVNSTEGWSTGLRLSALTLKTGGELLAPESVSYNRYTLDYLVTEVLARVPQATREFLLRTSILDRLCGPLCDAIAPPVDPEWDGRAYLHWLATENIFTFSLDAQGYWHRYHHLFQKLLRAELTRQMSAEGVAELHREASAWYAERGLIPEAIRHALSAGDELTAARLVENHGGQAINWERWRQLEQWLGLLPASLIDTRPQLLLFKAWLVQNEWRLADLPVYLDRIEALLGPEPQRDMEQTRVAGEVDALRSASTYYALRLNESIAYAERALATLPLACSMARSTAWAYLTNRGMVLGDAHAAVDILREALKEDRVHGDAFPTRLYMGLGHIYLMQGDLANLFQSATQLLQIAQQRELNEAIGWARFFRGCACYLQNDLKAAHTELSAAVGQRYITNAFVYSQAAYALVLTLIALGQFDQANAMLDSAAGYALEITNSRALVDMDALRAAVARRTGAVARAHVWATSLPRDATLVPMTSFSVPMMERVRVLALEGSPESLAVAARDLERLREQATPIHCARYLCELFALGALILTGQGEGRDAFEALRQALALGEPRGLIRVFVDLGPEMGRMLTRYVARYGASEYCRKLLAAFAADAAALGQANTPAAGRTSGGETPRVIDQLDEELIEPLSRRELDVLFLLSQRLTDKEIARELSISPQTVKRHAANVYQKLDVGNRRDAVAKGAALGLLSGLSDSARVPR